MSKPVLAGRPMMGLPRETCEILCLAHHRQAHQDLWHRKFSEHGQQVIILMPLLARTQFLHFPFAPLPFLPFSNSLLPSCLLLSGCALHLLWTPGHPSLLIFTINFLKPLWLKWHHGIHSQSPPLSLIVFMNHSESRISACCIHSKVPF